MNTRKAFPRAWPVRYEEFEPYYCRAEQMLSVHGEAGVDPTEPPRSAPFPYPAVPHERYVEDLRTRLESQKLHPYFLPLGIDLRPGGRCIRCRTCDGFPCKVHAKSEADVSCVRPALESGNIELMTRAFARRLVIDGSGKKITEVEIERDGENLRVTGRDICRFVRRSELRLSSAAVRFFSSSKRTRKLVWIGWPELYGSQQHRFDGNRSLPRQSDQLPKDHGH